MTGLASDGGLYVPEVWPVLCTAEMEALPGLSWQGSYHRARKERTSKSWKTRAVKVHGEEADPGFRSRCRDMKLDRIDIKILAELQKNGRLTNIELADRVHLSASPCLMRLKKLQGAGLIRGFAAEIDLTQLADVLTVFTEVTLVRHGMQDLSRFVDALANVEHVVECHLISSGYDYLVKFNTCGIAQYQEIIENLSDMDLGILKYFSYVVFKTAIMPRQLPVTAVFQNASQ